MSLQYGSALALPFADASFTAGYMLHVGMNIADKVSLFAGIARLLISGARFAVVGVMSMVDHELPYPLPWASGPADNAIARPPITTRRSRRPASRWCRSETGATLRSDTSRSTASAYRPNLDPAP